MSLVFGFSYSTPPVIAQDIVKTTSGTVNFVSEAPLEVIKAKSGNLNAVLNLNTRSFAFSVPMTSFQGFNSPLQREHFNENYIESKRYPHGSFKGKIIEEVNLKQNGTYTVRAKGILTIHGVEAERIFKSTVIVNNGTIKISSKFDVKLEDHAISIPKIVNQKIAEVIFVEVNATLAP
ncbi:MAG: YceI family protein [Bacteroidia bacterium]|nr:YceI family protein [Bacteroidia bacterium]